MISIIEADVFWSDIVLGLVAIGCAAYLQSRARRWTPVFILLAIATWLGAFYHGLINTTTVLRGDILWSLTLLCFAAAALAIAHVVLGKRSRPFLVALFVAYGVYAVFINEKFIWALVLQALSLLLYGAYVIKISDRRAIIFYVAFFALDVVAVIIQQAKINFGLEISHNTIFHLIEMPSLVLLALSMKYNDAKVTRRTK